MIHHTNTISNPIIYNPIILFLFLYLSVFATPTLTEAMMKKIHPSPSTKRLLSPRDRSPPHMPPKRLRRLPHVFAKVLELPLPSNTHVAIQETSYSLCFIADVAAGYVDGEMRAYAVEIYAGVTKVVVGRDGDMEEGDMWRFRLPREAVMEMVTAEVVDGELVVTVPKRGEGREEGLGAVGRLVVVQ